MSIGDILREFKYDIQSEKGKIITELFEKYQMTGVYPPFDIPAQIMLEHLQINYGKICLIDGFQKTMDMVKCWEKYVELNVNLRMVVVLDCSVEILKNRLLCRSGGIRKDGTVEIIEKRLVNFFIENSKIVEYFQNKINPDEFFMLNTDKLADEVLSDFENLLKSKNLII